MNFDKKLAIPRSGVPKGNHQSYKAALAPPSFLRT